MPKKMSSSNKQLSEDINVLHAISFAITYVIIITLVIILHYSMFSWTNELEKTGCECSDLWHRNIIHWIALIMLVFIAVNMLLLIAKVRSQLFSAFAGLIGVVNVFYIILIYDYISKLKNLECKCSEDWKREYGYIGSIVYMSFYGLIMLILLTFILTVGFRSK
jgi:NhaP-type Na+/H+ or K+/H+ antiporter